MYSLGAATHLERGHSRVDVTPSAVLTSQTTVTHSDWGNCDEMLSRQAKRGAGKPRGTASATWGALLPQMCGKKKKSWALRESWWRCAAATLIGGCAWKLGLARSVENRRVTVMLWPWRLGCPACSACAPGSGCPGHAASGRPPRTYRPPLQSRRPPSKILKYLGLRLLLGLGPQGGQPLGRLARCALAAGRRSLRAGGARGHGAGQAPHMSALCSAPRRRRHLWGTGMPAELVTQVAAHAGPAALGTPDQRS